MNKENELSNFIKDMENKIYTAFGISPKIINYVETEINKCK